MLPQRVWQMHLRWLWQQFPLIIPSLPSAFQCPQKPAEVNGSWMRTPRPELIALPKVIVRPQAALSPGLYQMPPEGKWPGAAQFSADQAVTQSTGFQARQSLHSTVLRNAGGPRQGEGPGCPEECYLPVTVMIHPAGRPQRLKRISSCFSRFPASSRHRTNIFT